MISLSHQSEGGRLRHAMKIAADLFILPRPSNAGVPVPRPRCGGEPRHRLRGVGHAANLKFGASAGALRHEVDDVCPARVSRRLHGRPFEKWASSTLRNLALENLLDVQDLFERGAKNHD